MGALVRSSTVLMQPLSPRPQSFGTELRPMATETRQGLATLWQTEVLDTGLIQDELNKLWNQLGGPPGGGQRPGEMIAEERFGGGMLMRANTLNLLAVADTQKDIRLIEETIRQLTDFQPSRTIILIAGPPDEDRA